MLGEVFDFTFTLLVLLLIILIWLVPVILVEKSNRTQGNEKVA
jgi:hypothetical protein